MLSKTTPLLLTASLKITLRLSDGLICIHFPNVRGQHTYLAGTFSNPY